MRTSVKVLIGVVVVGVVLAGAGIWWFLQDDAPDEVSLDAAIESVGTTTPSDGSEPVGSTPAAGVEGSWTVDTESGEFDFESATGSFAGFRIDEELSGIGSTTAVGRTGDITGTMEIEGSTVTEASFEIDVTTITTNDSRRDDRVQGALDTDEFTTATFTLTEPIELGDDAADGEPQSVTAIGDLTIHGETQPVEFALDAQLVEGTVVAVGSVDITFSDYGVEVPSSPVVVSAEDHGILELQLLLVRA